jgi:hypothetical protein
VEGILANAGVESAIAIALVNGTPAAQFVFVFP